MKTRILLAASLAILAAGCSREGSSEAGGKETAVEVASKPFTIGNDVADQMGSHVGEMGTDRDGDPALNAMAGQDTIPIGPEPSMPVDAQQGDEAAANSQFTTEGGPEG